MFWNSNSKTAHGRYVGSYGRGTAVTTSDIDILVELPKEEFERYNDMKGNVQSRLLAAVRVAIKNVYPTSDVSADGQVVKIHFSDGIKFEVLPTFKTTDNQFVYPDSNMGGNWLVTNPLAEQESISVKDSNSNGLLKDTCKTIRLIRNNHYSSNTLSGIVIDSFVYAAIEDWHWTDPAWEESPNSYTTYEKHLLSRFQELNYSGSLQVKTPGSDQEINSKKSVEYLKKILNLMV